MALNPVKLPLRSNKKNPAEMRDFCFYIKNTPQMEITQWMFTIPE